jgi:hypothetical protein
MDREVMLEEPTLPQLRERVQRNTERIDRHEVALNKMQMENAEQKRNISEFDRRLELSSKEHDRWMREWRQAMKESSRKFDEELAQSRRELKAELAESRRKFDEDVAQSRKEFKEDLEESSRKFKEGLEESSRKFKEDLEESSRRFEEINAKTNAAITRISTEFLGVTGHIVEGLASSAVDEVFKAAGLPLLHFGKNIKPKQPEVNNQMEVDVMLGNDRFTVPVEVKANFTKKKVKRFLRKMEMFRPLFPEYCDRDVLAAICAINYEDGADQLAHDEGLLVIRVNSDNVFSLDPFDEEKLRRF